MWIDPDPTVELRILEALSGIELAVRSAGPPRIFLIIPACRFDHFQVGSSSAQRKNLY